MSAKPREATAETQAVHAEFLRSLPFDDRRDYEDVRRGLIAQLPNDGVVKDHQDRVVFDAASLQYPTQMPDAPSSVNPSLWRQAQLMAVGGLFEVVPGIYQVRNHDLANVTFIETEDSVVVMDTGATTECGLVARKLYYEHRPKKPISTIIYTHTHADHFGGVLAFASREEVAAGTVSIIAPGIEFDRLALGENVNAGNVMGRRSQYFFGELLSPSERSFVTCGIGTALSIGSIGYISPTDIITETGTQRKIGGLTFEFQYAPDTEAPEEMHIWIPELKALSCAENANHTLHNIQTLRGARTRDASKFAEYLDEAVERYVDQAEVHFGPHTWPVWGNENVRQFLESQTDAYKFIHDEALRLANHGYRPIEIAERVTFPDTLARSWWNRGYHGTLNHNLKAVFAKELGWYNGNPATLYPHPDKVSAPRYVTAMGGAERVIDLARDAYDDGDYRWSAELLDHLVTADPADETARELLADAYEQLGYQSEGPQWRNCFLTAALEVREGVQRAPAAVPGMDIVLGMPLDMVFDYAAIRLNGAEAVAHPARFNISIEDLPGAHSLQVRNGVLHYWPHQLDDVDATITLPHEALVATLFASGAFEQLLAAGKIQIDGSADAFKTFVGLLDVFDPYFAVATPVAET
jgi:alkyl sulfatase BDS1-like metallo-beta-lactamase superfamily hydrolase